jgi:hypothetical protein
LKFLPTHFLLPILGATLFAACSPAAPEISKVPVPAGAPVSRAFGIWTPNTASGDTCSKEIHDQYWTYGPDGKVYPSWHPAVDASGCTFGHEHGRNPKDSKLISLTLPFGYVNEQLSPSDPQYQRNEDHVGHKVEWANDIEISRDNRPYTKCDVLFKLHQGTHSPDALTNNLHELFYYASCGDGTKIQWRNLQPLGHGGKFHERECDSRKRTEVDVGVPTPANSPNKDGSERILPAKDCVETETLVAQGKGSQRGALTENWVIGVGRWAKHDPNKEAMSFDFGPYFQVNNPSRYFDPTAPTKSRDPSTCASNVAIWNGVATKRAIRYAPKPQAARWPTPTRDHHLMVRIARFT